MNFNTHAWQRHDSTKLHYTDKIGVGKSRLKRKRCKVANICRFMYYTFYSDNIINPRRPILLGTVPITVLHIGANVSYCNCVMK